jgi:hypothetical protein
MSRWWIYEPVFVGSSNPTTDQLKDLFQFDFRTIISLLDESAQRPNYDVGKAEANLTEISRQIFLRYICLLNMGLNGELPEWVLPEPGKLSSRSSRPKTSANILDRLVLHPTLTDRLEKRMEEWGLYEDWIRRMSLRLFGKLPQR